MRPQISLADKILEAMKAYKPGENFTSNEIAEMSEVRKGRVQVYFSAMAKQNKIILVDKSKYPFVYRWASPSEHHISQSMKKHSKELKAKQREESKTEEPYKFPPEDLYNSNPDISPLQIGLGIIGLIQSLKNGGDHDMKALKFRIKELEGTLNFKDQELHTKKNQLIQYQALLTRKDKQIELLSSHLGVLSKGSGISIKDILDKV